MRKDPEKLLARRIEAVYRAAAVRLPLRTVRHWRGRRFVTRKRCVVSGFVGTSL